MTVRFVKVTEWGEGGWWRARSGGRAMDAWGATAHIWGSALRPRAIAGGGRAMEASVASIAF